MAVCQKIRSKRRRVCVADLDRLITIENRSITPPSAGSVDYTETFTTKDEPESPSGEVWAKLETRNGESVFDATNVERTVTHKFTIRFIEGITAETWILYNGKRFDILDTENLDERNEFIVLPCNVRGVSTNSVNAS